MSRISRTMKIIYCTHSTYNPGGMERVLLNKVTYLSQVVFQKVCLEEILKKDQPKF